LALALLPLVMLLVVSCVRRKEETVYMLGSEGVTLQGEATLVCSDPCVGSAQCGTLDKRWVILASSTGPATQGHDLTFSDKAQVTIVSNQMEVLQSVSDPSIDQRMIFYQVNVPDQGAGWVAGWCIGQEIVP
jgi:hypothetical protein